MSRKVRSLLQDAPIIDPTATGSQIYDLFSEDPDLVVCAVVEDTHPVGLISRNTFFLRMANRHGRDLYARRPITCVMDKNPLRVEASEPVSEVSKNMLTDHSSALFDGFIITENGRYAGVGTGVGLMKLVREESEDRNKKLISLAEQLARARTEAMNADQAKTDFLAIFSHEIRTPLNGVLGLADMLAQSDLNEDQAKLTSAIQSSGKVLQRLLNDVLDLSQIQAGKLELETIDFDFEQIIVDAEALWAPQAAGKGIEFSIQHLNGQQELLEGDPVRIKQVLFNLIGNAMKFTTTGSVNVTIRFTPHGLDQFNVHCEVIDTGCGIPDSARTRLFSPFNQASSDVQRKHGGTGLGLAICKQLIESMGGKIGYHSRENHGSRFWFEVPLAKAKTVHYIFDDEVDGDGPAEQASPIPARSDDDGASLKILVAEDNPINQEVISGFLKLRGLSCEFANNGVEAIEAVEAKIYDLIIMDVQMPQLDGIEATRAIRASSSPSAQTPILAITANAMTSDEARCRKAGMDGYLSKPIDRKRLFAEIDRLTDAGKAASADLNDQADIARSQAG